MVLNAGRTYDAKYDRRHKVDITCNYKFNDKFDMSATWLLESGNCGTLYTQYYDSQPLLIQGETDSKTLGYYENRNNLRLNPSHRLDLSFNWHRKFNDRLKRTFNLSIYNAYNNRNPFLVYIYTHSYYLTDPDGHTRYHEERTLKQLTLFPILPSISYTLSF